jgi:hypothetical protein
LDNDFETWWAWLKERVNEARDVPNGLTMTVFIMWYLWRERNDRTFKGSQGDPSRVLAKSIDMCREFSDATSTRQQGQGQAANKARCAMAEATSQNA